MQIASGGGRGRRALAVVRARVGAVALTVLYLVTAAAAPAFWRTSRSTRVERDAGR